MFRTFLQIAIEFFTSAVPLIKGSAGLSNYNCFTVAGAASITLSGNPLRISVHIYNRSIPTTVTVLFLGLSEKIQVLSSMTDQPLALKFSELGSIIYNEMIITAFGGDAITVIERIKQN